MYSQEEVVELVLDCLKQIDSSDPAAARLASYLYSSDNKLPRHLEKLQEFIQLKKPTPAESRRAGKLLEQIMYLAFSGLKGVNSIKNFQSPGPQYDLLVSGDEPAWLTVCKLLYMDVNQRGIVIEAKATGDPVSDQQFGRLCSIMELNLFGTVGLGVFFSLNGASGFPSKESASRQHKISESRLRQVIFHARTRKAIIVLDKHDFLELGKNGTLIQILNRKIRDLSELSGLPTPSCVEPIETDLPEHLRGID